MGNRSNIFTEIENSLISAETQVITETALCALKDYVREMLEMDDGVKYGSMILGAKLGLGGGPISIREKELVDSVFSPVCDGSMDEVYEMLEAAVEDEDYEKIEILTQFGPQIAMPFLYYLLSFAYIDGRPEDKAMEKLDDIFAKVLDF